MSNTAWVTLVIVAFFVGWYGNALYYNAFVAPYSIICIDDIMYYQFATGTTLEAHAATGAVRTCSSLPEDHP